MVKWNKGTGVGWAVTLTLGMTLAALVSADVNKNHKTENTVFVVTTPHESLVSETRELLPRVPAGMFGSPTNYSTGSWPQCVTAANLDGDSDCDLGFTHD